MRNQMQEIPTRGQTAEQEDTMNRLGPIDAAFITLETPRTPMNIGALLTFRLPEKAPRDYLRKLFMTLREQPVTNPPFNYKLLNKRMARIAPAREAAK